MSDTSMGDGPYRTNDLEAREDIYWCQLPADEFVVEAMRRVDLYAEKIEEEGRLGIWRKAVGTYYGLDPGGGWSNSAAVKYGGEQGENVLLRVNHFGNLVDHITSLTTSNRLAAKARAISTGPEAAAQVQLADALIEYHLDGGLERESVTAVRYALLFGEAFLTCLWDTDGASAIHASTVQEGDIYERAYTPIDVIRDTFRSTDDLDWAIVRHRRNRWDMIANYPEWEEELRAATPYGNDRNGYLWPFDLHTEEQRADRDEIAVYEFFHRPTPAMPLGRLVLFVEDAPLRDGPNRYDKIPLQTMRPIPEMFAPFGFSRLWDLLGLSEMLDSVVSVLATNIDAFGVQGVWTAPGSNIDAEEIARGLVHFESAEPPQAVQLTEVPKAAQEMVEWLVRTHETLSGVNSVARGDIPSNVRSGNALAMVHQVALQFNSALQGSYARMMESQFTDMIHIYQKFAESPRLVDMVGHDEAGYVAEFKGEDLHLIKRVAVDLGNPMLRTSAGRMDVAQVFVDKGLVQDPQQFLTFVATGRLPELYRASRADAILIKRENEVLRKGVEVKALLTDMHQSHVREHAAELATPDVRADDKVAGVILAHIQEHINLATNMPPALAILTGQQNLLKIMEMMAAGDPAQAVPSPEPPGDPSAMAPGDAGPAGAGAAQPGSMNPEREPSEGLPNPVNMPTDPMTGNEYNPESGTGVRE